MINRFFSVLLFCVQIPLYAQIPIQLPEESQRSSISQRIDFTDISVTYNAPGAKGRKIFGALVPYNQVWRAGANDNTVIRFSTDVSIDGKLVKAGAYGLHIIPSASEWIFIFSSKTGDWGSYRYDSAFDVLRFTAPVQEAPATEWLQFNFTGRAPGKARLELQWENVRSGFDITTDPALILANFDDQLRNRPGFGYLGWMQAANYCLGKNIMLDRALAYADTSIKRTARFDNLYLKSRILAKIGKTNERFATVKEALELGTDAEIYRATDDFLKEGLTSNAEEASAVLARLYAKSWMTPLAKGRIQAAKGDKKGAKTSYVAALKLVPPARKKMVEDLLGAL